MKKLASAIIGGATLMLASQVSGPASAASAIKPVIGSGEQQATVDKVDYRCAWRYGHRRCWWAGHSYRRWDRDDWRPYRAYGYGWGGPRPWGYRYHRDWY
jgi:hypothetical protein